MRLYTAKLLFVPFIHEDAHYEQCYSYDPTYWAKEQKAYKQQ